eukprot:2405008-Alexandrium_andersonii.AAC.1
MPVQDAVVASCALRLWPCGAAALAMRAVPPCSAVPIRPVGGRARHAWAGSRPRNRRTPARPRGSYAFGPV